MRNALSIGDAASAERAAHNLKGAAGTLGAVGLSEAAAGVETAIKAGRGVEGALKSLSLSLAAVLKAIWAAFPEEIVGNGAGQTSADPASALEPPPGSKSYWKPTTAKRLTSSSMPNPTCRGC